MPYEKFADGTTKDLSDEIPFDLPQGWTWTRLNSICEIATGPFGTNLHQRDYVRKGIPIVNPINMVDGLIIPDKYVSLETRNRLSEYILQKGMIVLGRRGEMGRSAIVTAEQDGWLCGTGSFFIKLCGSIDPTYSRLLFTSPYARKIIEGDSKGTTMFNLSQGTLSFLLFPLPPLAEQKRIVAKIEELFAYADQIGAAAEEITKTTQRLDKKILDLAIRGKLVPQDLNDEPASELVKRIEEQRQAKTGGKKSRAAASHKPTYEIEQPFDIPESWKWVKLSDLGSFVGGHTPSLSDTSNWADGDILWVTSKDMKQKYISDTGCKVSKKGASELHLLPKGSLIMVTRSGILRRTFPIAIASKPLTINQDQRAIEFYNSEMSEYIYCCLKSFEPIILRDYRKTGTTVESIIWDKFIHIPIPLPPLAEQKRIVKKIDELKEMTQALIAL